MCASEEAPMLIISGFGMWNRTMLGASLAVAAAKDILSKIIGHNFLDVVSAMRKEFPVVGSKKTSDAKKCCRRPPTGLQLEICDHEATT